jgi:hypothetical protein
MSASRAIATLAGLAAAAILAAGCGNPAPVVDEVVKIADGPTIATVKPFRPTGPPAAPRKLLQAPEVQPQPRTTVPAWVHRTIDIDTATMFVACEGASFYLYNGRLPTENDWLNMVGGAVLSQIPAYKAQQISDQLAEIEYSEHPFLAAVQLSQMLGCASL